MRSIKATLALLFFVALPCAAQTSLTFVQANSNSGGSVTSIARAFGSNNALHNLIIVGVEWDNQSANVSSITDTKLNTYTSTGTKQPGASTFELQIWFAKDVAAGANTVTANFSAATTSYAEIDIVEYSGADQSAPFDVAASASGSASPPSAGPITTNFANELIYGHASGSGIGTTPGTGFTARDTTLGHMLEDKSVTTAGSQTCVFNAGTNWLAWCASFKAATQPSGSTMKAIVVANKVQ